MHPRAQGAVLTPKRLAGRTTAPLPQTSGRGNTRLVGFYGEKSRLGFFPVAASCRVFAWLLPSSHWRWLLEALGAVLRPSGEEGREARTFCQVLHYTGCRVPEALVPTPQRVDLAGQVLIFEILKKTP